MQQRHKNKILAGHSTQAGRHFQKQFNLCCVPGHTRTTTACLFWRQYLSLGTGRLTQCQTSRQYLFVILPRSVQGQLPLVQWPLIFQTCPLTCNLWLQCKNTSYHRTLNTPRYNLSCKSHARCVGHLFLNVHVCILWTIIFISCLCEKILPE